MQSGAFIFDTFDDGLVVMPVAEARRLATLNEALCDSSTWGEFLSRVADDRETIEHLESSSEHGLRDADEAFDTEEISGFADGYWPTWPKRAMLDWLPASVVALGKRMDSASGDFLQLDEDLADAVITAMQAEGLECEEDADDLVSSACGAWRYGL